MIVIDTNIWVSYAMSPRGSIGKVVQDVLENDDYAFSKETFRELSEVLLRNKFDRYVLREKRITFLKVLASGAQWFVVDIQVSDCRDMKDNMFLELALTCQAQMIVTGDQDLLELHPYEGIDILKVSMLT